MNKNVKVPSYLVCRTDVILKAVFSQMPNEDLMQVMLVCRQWKDLGELAWKCETLKIDYTQKIKTRLKMCNTLGRHYKRVQISVL